jgi:hypothetical protein
MRSPNLGARVRQLEKQIGGSSGKKAEEGARAWARFCLQVGLVDPSSDIDTLTERFVKAGVTLESVLKAADGKTRGLPRDDEKFID